jgi:type II secretory pathway pseudopilin PulG
MKVSTRLKVSSKITGVTLIEIMLVTVIIGIILYSSMNYYQQKAFQMRIDRTSMQMQQILNAGLSYYVANGKWPVTTPATATTLSTLQTNNYLPNTSIVSPFNGASYTVATDASKNLFYVYVGITNSNSASAISTARVIAGTLPLSYTSGSAAAPPLASTACVAAAAPASTTCYVVAAVNIPGTNLNRAGAVNYAGLYKHGGCVPVPVCPVDAGGTKMTPQIMVVPVSVAGASDSSASVTAGSPLNVYPISSFTAYALPAAKDASGNPIPLTNAPPACQKSTAAATPDCTDTNNSDDISTSTYYWRVCLQVITTQGDVQDTNKTINDPKYDYGSNVSLMAITRCAQTGEPQGTKFTIYSN